MDPRKPEALHDIAIVHANDVYMKRALELAALGVGSVSPNPLVGCVIVHNGRIVGEGWHKKYGEAHAEVNAINAVEDKEVLKESTLYVNLEPCSHMGKTPPCVDLIIRHGLKKVVIANQDSNPLVAGQGIGKLRKAGVAVLTGINEADGYALNKRFFTYMERKRPHIILKWAETADGFIARTNHDSRWISDEYSRQLVHKWRSEEDAVLVGSGTAAFDNPRLNVRNWSGRDPVRILIDRSLKVSPESHVFDGRQTTICYNLVKEQIQENLIYSRLNPERFLDSIIEDLYGRRLQSVIVEGGSQILNAFIQSGLWDEARIFLSPQTFQTGIPAPGITGVLQKRQKLDKDWLSVVIPGDL